VTVVLSGDGGDELFGGYDRYLPHPNVARFDRHVAGVGRVLAAATWRRLPHGLRGKNFLRHVSREAQRRYLDSVTFYHADERRSLLSPASQQALGTWEAERYFRRPFRRLAGLPFGDQMMAFDFETYLPEDCLTKVDRMSMAHSIESRVPLLDHRVAEFAARLPVHLKIAGGVQKYLLKKLAYKLVSRPLLDRPKQGFSSALPYILKAEYRTLYEAALSDSRLVQAGILRADPIRALVAEQLAGRADHGNRLWLLVNAELWYRMMILGENRESLAPSVTAAAV
jgi:asparagine synthase (glutamine-hydrolysing)